MWRRRDVSSARHAADAQETYPVRVRDIEEPESSEWATMLRDARRDLGWTQDQLADAAGVTRTTILRWEGGQQEGKPASLRAVAEALGIPPAVAFQAIGWLPPEADEKPTLQKLLEDPLNRRFWDGMPSLPRSERINLLREYIKMRELEAEQLAQIRDEHDRKAAGA